MNRIGASLIIIAVVAVMVASCTTTKIVPVEVETVKERVHTQFLTDTIHTTDSIIIDRSPDTLRIERWRTVYKSTGLRDTVAVNDTIREPYPVEVEAKLTMWQQAKVNYGGWAMILLTVIALAAAIRFFKQTLRIWKGH